MQEKNINKQITEPGECKKNVDTLFFEKILYDLDSTDKDTK